MRFHKQVRLGGAVLCLLGIFFNHPSATVIGITVIFASTLIQGDNLEERLKVLEGDKDANE